MTTSQLGAWVVALGSLLCAWFCLNVAGLSLDLSNSRASIVLLAVVAALSLLRRRMSDPLIIKLLDFFELITLFLIVSTGGLLLTYAVAGWSGDYVGALLARADRAMGFNWMLLYDFMDAHREAMFASKQIYFSIFATPIVLAGLHAWADDRHRFYSFLLAYLMALIITAILFAFFPAKSAVPYYIGANPSYPAAVVNQHVLAIDAIKAGELTLVKLDEALGLVAFPSFHAAAAVLFMWAAWPYRAFRVPLIAINLGMIATAFVEGSHYLIDILGGVGVATVSLAAVSAPWPTKARAAPRRRLARVRSKDAAQVQPPPLAEA